MIFRKLVILFSALIFSATAFAAKLSGRVSDKKNEPLAFLTVNIEGTTVSTMTNINGEYFLDLKDGFYHVVFRYIGYRTETRNIEIRGNDVTLDVTMDPQAIVLMEADVNGNGEDPSYEIIRKAQQKRKFYLEQVKKYSCDVYIKGMNYAENVPKSILGRNIEIDGLDKNRSGIVYLSESVSRLHFEAPNKRKETVISSKVSGKSQAFTWNSAIDFDFNFYEPNIEVSFAERNFISPIAPSAMLHYRYKLAGAFYEDTVLINKIEIIPRVKGSPVYNGFIYIQENTWRIHSIEFYLTRESNIEFLDTLKIKQVYIPVSNDVWMKGTQNFNFKFDVKLLGFKGNGYFNGVYSKYDLGPEFSKKFFKAEKLKVEENSNKRSEEYWNDVRLVPLTPLEVQDYKLKDSVEVLKESKVYMDSIDTKKNKYHVSNFIFGYTMRNSFKNIDWNIPTLFEILQFNTVEGIVINPTYSVEWEHKELKKRLRIDNAFRYGFSSQKFYGKLGFNYRFNAINRMSIRAEVGKFVSQFNEANPIAPFINSLYTVFLEKNYLKIFEKTYANVGWGSEIFNGVTLNTGIEYAARNPLLNAGNLSAVYVDSKNKEFTSNNPQNPASDLAAFVPYRSFTFNASLRIRFGQKYYLYPHEKFNSDSKYPAIRIAYEKGIAGIFQSKTNFDFVKISVEDDMKLGVFGTSEYTVSVGKFFNTNTVPFVDYRHFMTSEVILAPQRLSAFRAMPYYRLSTTGEYLEAHYEHHFNGFLFGTIPVWKKLGWQPVAGSHLLLDFRNNHQYVEVTAGLEHIFKIGRVDFVAAFENNHKARTAIRISLGF